jgi:multimeric flavodoxin WrbA
VPARAVLRTVKPLQVVAFTSSPRLDGNSRLLAESVLEGARSAGHATEVVHLPAVLDGLLRDCRTCRGADGVCSIDDGMGDAFERYLAADVVVYATPLWWYGMSSWMKAFIDRFFCFTTASAPGHDAIRERIVAKKAVLVMSEEERYPAAVAGVVHQIQELSRYLHHELVGVVVGVGNSRGEVVSDPADPVARARELGARLTDVRGTDYRVDTERPNRVWSEP